MSARDVIATAASDCQSVVIRGDVYELTDAILTALAAAGYKVLSREPTAAMNDAARDWSYEKYGKPIGNDASIGCWRAMFDAKEKPE